jgi:hypothetical protein
MPSTDDRFKDFRGSKEGIVADRTQATEDTNDMNDMNDERHQRHEYR